jgi:hypothetical protein
MRSQIQQLQQAIDAKHPPELLAAMVKKAIADASKVMMDTQYAAMQAAEVVTAVPAVAPVADALLQGADFPHPSTQQAAPPVAAPGLALEAVKNRHTGVDFMPGGGNPQASTNPTSPAPMPTPASPGVGAGQGIETQRNDGVKQ